jgi:hypothetical protein
MLRRSVKAAAVASGVGMAALFVDAPTADAGDGSYAATQEARAQVFPEWLHDLGRLPIFAAATLVAKVYLGSLNDTRVEGREILIDQLEHKPASKAIITVSNHSATVDDPGVIATYVRGLRGVLARTRTHRCLWWTQHDAVEVRVAALRPVELLQVRGESSIGSGSRAVRP